MNNRIDQLDSIRGLAALTVFIGHIYETYPLFSKVVSEYSPFKLLINGHAAVMMFFILSGLVLMFPFLKGYQINYKSFLIKRFCRIYFSYLSAILFAIGLSTILSGKIEGFGDYFNQFWNYDLSAKLIIEHLFFVGNIHSDAFDPVIWSLIHEMRISIIFPMIAFLVIRLNWKYNILIGMMLSLITGISHLFHLEKSNGYLIGYTDTFQFISMFILGALIAKNLEKIIDIYNKISRKSKLCALFMAFILYDFADKITSNWLLSDYLTSIGACILIIVSIGSIRVRQVLIKKPLLFFGKISYSLYLYHFIVLLCLTHLFHQVIPMWSFYLIYFVVSILMAFIGWKLVENPSINLGRLVSQRWQNSTQSNTAASSLK